MDWLVIKPVHPRLGWIVRSSPEVLVGRGVLRADQGPRMNLERREGHQGRADDSLNGPQEGGGSQGQPVRMRFQNVTTCDNNNYGVYDDDGDVEIDRCHHGSWVKAGKHHRLGSHCLNNNNNIINGHSMITLLTVMLIVKNL